MPDSFRDSYGPFALALELCSDTRSTSPCFVGGSYVAVWGGICYQDPQLGACAKGS